MYVCTQSLVYIFLCVNEKELMHGLQGLQTRLWKVLPKEKFRDMFGAMHQMKLNKCWIPLLLNATVEK